MVRSREKETKDLGEGHSKEKKSKYRNRHEAGAKPSQSRGRWKR